MAKKTIYKITSSPKRSRGVFHKIFRNKHKRQLIISISSVYVMLATVIGIGLFNSIQEPAQANQPAFIASVINLEEGQELQIGEQVELSLTLQNTSQNESINDINVSLLSTEMLSTGTKLVPKPNFPVVKPTKLMKKIKQLFLS
ncbi:hypothetical protein HC766_00220 [Candidatus Gracilibacteria bacterium]|nr:hypothetical protein [Candidatus Gracilibacteria bacterium]